MSMKPNSNPCATGFVQRLFPREHEHEHASEHDGRRGGLRRRRALLRVVAAKHEVREHGDQHGRPRRQRRHQHAASRHRRQREVAAAHGQRRHRRQQRQLADLPRDVAGRHAALQRHGADWVRKQRVPTRERVRCPHHARHHQALHRAADLHRRDVDLARERLGVGGAACRARQAHRHARQRALADDGRQREQQRRREGEREADDDLADVAADDLGAGRRRERRGDEAAHHDEEGGPLHRGEVRAEHGGGEEARHQRLAGEHDREERRAGGADGGAHGDEADEVHDAGDDQQRPRRRSHDHGGGC
mmetsp:Transcript_7730/g.27477  ORF Transcript_7730/g.27477 Transcript_7730/m.27477 type:complete len:305 (+) Transcript_7730:62-976(+)